MNATSTYYDPSRTMLPQISGTIRVMQGGFSESSLLKHVPSHMASIIPYSGGSNNNASRVAVASTASTASAASTDAQTQVAKSVSSPEPIAVAVSSASTAAQTHVANSVSSPEPIAVAVSSASTAAQTQVAKSVSSPEPIAVAVSSASSAAQTHVANSVSSPEPIAVAVSSASSAAQKPDSNRIKAAIAVVASKDEKNSYKKTIKIYGKEYNVFNPRDKNTEDDWKKLIHELGLELLSEPDQQEFKEMLYDNPRCIEQDLPISTSIHCEPIRKIIFKISKQLIETTASDGRTIIVNFTPESKVTAISNPI